MAKARKPAKGRSESAYVVAQFANRLVLGQVVHESATGLVKLRVADGTVLELVPDGRLMDAASPDVFAEVSFSPPSGDETQRFDALVSLFREEQKTAEERRLWAKAVIGADLPAGKEVDELLRYRYEQLRAEWMSTLRNILSGSVAAGNDRLLLAALEQGVPTDVRRLASDIAVETRSLSSVTPLCAAAIHKTQAAFARDAARALAQLAPERLPLIARVVHRDVMDAIDLASSSSLREAKVLGLEPPGPEQSVDNAVSSDDRQSAIPATLRGEVLMHLTLALPVVDQTRILSSSSIEPGQQSVASMLRVAIRDSFRAIVEKESPTGYELLLRTALAQLILADSSADVSDLLAVAARSLARDADAGTLRDLTLTLPEEVAARLVRAAIVGLRMERLTALLADIAEGRPSLARLVAPALRSGLKGGDWQPSIRPTVLGLLAADTESHQFVAREVVREFANDTSPETEALARAIVRNGVVIELSHVRQSGRASLINALVDGSPRYAASVIRALLTDREQVTTWEALNNLVFPIDWITTDDDLRASLIEWLPIAVAHRISASFRDSYIGILSSDAPDAWSQWSVAIRDAAMSVLRDTNPAVALPILAAVASRMKPGEENRAKLVESLVGDFLACDPESLPLVSAVIPNEELQSALLLHGVTLDRLIAQRRADDQSLHVAAGERLAADLQRELERAQYALRREDQLGALFARLSEDVAALLPRSKTEDPEVVDFVAEFSPSTTRAAAQDDELLSALRRLGGRSRSSQAALSFFRERIATLLQVMSRAEVEAFVERRRSVLDRLPLSAIAPVAVALLRCGGDPSRIWALLGGGRDARGAVDVALGAGTAHTAAGTELLRIAAVDIGTLTAAVASRSAEWRELSTRQSTVSGSIVDLARRLAPTIEAIDGLILNYGRVRHVLGAHGLAPIEPVLGQRHGLSHLTPGAHRVVGLSLGEGIYEVQTHGMKLADSGDVVVPAAVARQADVGDTP
ncbi:MAG: hypothetical protein V4550_08240 [Gemmatimonadota bacterium]